MKSERSWAGIICGFVLFIVVCLSLLLRSIGVSAGESKSATEIIAVSGARCWVGFAPSRGVDSSAVYEVRV